MGKRGTKPEATELKLLKGTRQDRINADEPIPRIGEISPPVWMSEKALEIWAWKSPDLIEKKVLTEWDVEMFAVWCDAYARVAELSAYLTGVDSYTDFGSRGLVKNPKFQALKDCWDTMLKYGARFGLTPSDRSTIKVDKPNENGKGAERLLS